uniref:Uncharacterized protein n=1 Tax=Gongylonema pulchrum TaxID=637853 RepID=A0A183ERX4_9BILA
LQWNAPFSDELFDFFLSLFNRWPPSPTFGHLFDVWVTWIRPWRYCGNDLKRVMPFIRSNRRFYIELSDAFWRRSFALECAEDVEILASYITILTSPEFLKVYEELEYSIESNVLNLMNTLRENADEFRAKVFGEEMRLQKANWFQRFFLCGDEQDRLSKHKKALEELERLIVSAEIALIGGEDNEFRSRETPAAAATDSSETLRDSSYSPNSLAKQIPDHYVDPATKLIYLTPLGRQQVRFFLCYNVFQNENSSGFKC